MKILLLTGASLGFLCGIAFSLIQDESWLVCLWHGGLAAVIASLLLPWWDHAWKKHEQEMTESKAAADTLITASNTANTSKS